MSTIWDDPARKEPDYAAQYAATVRSERLTRLTLGTLIGLLFALCIAAIGYAIYAEANFPLTTKTVVAMYAQHETRGAVVNGNGSVHGSTEWYLVAGDGTTLHVTGSLYARTKVGDSRTGKWR